MEFIRPPCRIWSMTQDKARFDVLGQLGSLRRYARSLTRDEGEAEDLVHDALVRAYEKRSSFDAQRDLRRWLFSIVHNRFIDMKRSAQAKANNASAAAETAEAGGRRSDPAQEHAARLSEVREHFMSLPEEQRSALHLVAIEGLSYSEAASALDIPVGTLMSRISRARAALRAMEDSGIPRDQNGSNSAPRAGARILRIIGGTNDAGD